jgi:predicted ATPase
MQTITVEDKRIPKKRRDEISALRAERWSLFAALHTRGNREGLYLMSSPEAAQAAKAEDDRRWTRIAEINTRLFILTGNPIYDTEQ